CARSPNYYGSGYGDWYFDVW
nr:immunoglobulin heavy chain junction region [Mus musculus]